MKKQTPGKKPPFIFGKKKSNLPDLDNPVEQWRKGAAGPPKKRASSKSSGTKRNQPDFLAKPKPTKGKNTPEEEVSSEWPMRLNKFVAHCGVCSRREAAELVKQGRIKVNQVVIKEPGTTVEEKDIVEYEGKVIRPEINKVYILLNKPKDAITTSDDEKGRKTVLDIIGKQVKERIYPVGRLDRQTTGLLMLTNDGDLAQKLSHPSNKVSKVYIATLDRKMREDDMEKIRAGLTLEDGLVQVDAIHYTDEGAKKEIIIEIHSGKNRIVRRIFEHFGYEVKTLDRTYYAGLTKKDLPRGKFRPLTQREVIMLKHFSG